MNPKSFSNCHLWNKPDLTFEDLKNSLDDIQTYQDESHLMRSLKKCKLCGQLFFYEFSEEVDWVDSEDAQYRSWIPVTDAEKAEQMNMLSSGELQQLSRIIVDWPSDQKSPSAPKKIALPGE